MVGLGIKADPRSFLPHLQDCGNLLFY